MRRICLVIGKFLAYSALGLACGWPAAVAQSFALVGPQQPAAEGAQAAPATLTLQDALRRAQRYEPQFLTALSAAQTAREDAVQARAALLPTAGAHSEYMNTQGNGVFPSGRYVTQDGVHVYREWATFHQDLSPGTLTRTGYQRAQVAQAVAQAKAEVARRGLTVTVTKAYYALVVAQRKYATAQLSLMQAQQSLTITQDLERGGEAPHSDVVKAQIQVNAQDQALRDARLAMENARLDLAVLISADFDQNFQVASARGRVVVSPGP